MKRFARNKICFQTNEIVWNNEKQLLSFKKKKWRFLKRKVKKNIVLDEKQRPRSLKQLYKKRLYTRQLLKAFYGFLPEYKLKTLLKISINKSKKNFVENFIVLLESRIDTLLYRLGCVNSIFEAKQLISHGNIEVNNKKINSSNVFLSPGDLIKIKSMKDDFKEKQLDYIEYNKNLNLFVFLKKPSFKNIQYSFSLNKEFLL